VKALDRTEESLILWEGRREICWSKWIKWCGAPNKASEVEKKLGASPGWRRLRPTRVRKNVWNRREQRGENRKTRTRRSRSRVGELKSHWQFGTAMHCSKQGSRRCPFKQGRPPGQAKKETRALFPSLSNFKFLHYLSITSIFRCMYGALNVGKRNN
jgi:hypothetical protein